jgi:rod shape-determining protein MreC
MPSFLKKKKNLVVLFCLIFFQLILISLQAPLGSESSLFEKTVFSVFSPIQNGVSAIIGGIGNLWKGYFSLRGVYKENQNIKRELFFLQLENRLIRGLLDWSTKKADIKETLEDIRENIVFSRVIEIDLMNQYKSVVINRGLFDGIEKDMIVLDKFGQLVGRVIGPVALKESRVQLITDSESGVSVHNQKDILGVINGNDEGRCILKYIEGTESDVYVGDILVTSGFDHIYPPGIPVGKIFSVDPADELFKNILVDPFFKFRSLDELAVIKIDPNVIF